jgi:endonuclease/exonuclease/phosphatase family metal-dependent hydrolase
VASSLKFDKGSRKKRRKVMKVKTVQWNIGGGKARKPDSDINLLSSYDTDGLDEIIKLLKELSPDIITLQEVHSDATSNQAETIAKAVGLKYCVSDFYADSHIEKGQKLGQGIISRYKITDHSFQLFTNPQYEVVWEDGSKAISHDKGVTTCVIEVDGKPLVLKTLHAIPFRRFEIDPLGEDARPVLEDMQAKLKVEDDFIIQGDFNLDYPTLAPVLPKLFAQANEITLDNPTTPKGRKYDHVVFRGLSLISTQILDNVLTDHYPVVTELSRF